jgi:hypothetical protein
MEEITFTLTNEKPFKVFKLANPDSVINIFQVFINLLMDKPHTEWSSLVTQWDLYLEFSNSKHGKIDKTIEFLHFISTHHAIPVIEICGMHVPEKHINNKPGDDFYSDITIELKSHKGKLPDHIRADVSCMISPGVSEA